MTAAAEGEGKKAQETKSPPPPPQAQLASFLSSCSDATFIKLFSEKGEMSGTLPITQFFGVYTHYGTYVRRPSQIGCGGETISCFTVNRKVSPSPRPLFHVTPQGWFLLGMEYWRPDSEAPAHRHRPTRIHMRANTCIQKRHLLGLGLGFTMMQMQKVY